MLKKISLALAYLAITLSSCQSQQNTVISMDIKPMNTSERINYALERVKKYKDQPLYQLKVASPLHFEIRINDFPVYTKYGDSKGMVYVPLNQTILGSGKQKINIKILPPSDDPKALIPKDSYFVMELYQTAWEDGSLTEPKTILSYKLDLEKQDYSNLTQVIEVETFTAKVPYTITRWSKGKDLRKLDQKLLEDQVVAFYKKMNELSKNHESDLYKTYFLHADIDWYQSEYFDKKTINELQIAMDKYKDIIEAEFFPFENYEMRFAANGRVAYLVFKSGEHKGESLHSFLSYDKETGRQSYTYLNLFLSIPEGSDQLEVI